MKNFAWLRGALLFALGCAVGGLIVATVSRQTAVAQSDNPQVDLAKLQADVNRLKTITPPNSHPMVDVAMLAANVWYAGDKKNWLLANYYLGEMRNRMKWEVNLNPGPKGPDGNPVPMQSIFDGIDNGSIPALKKTIDAKDSAQFAPAYKHMLEDCYSCHKALGRPYLRPQVPEDGGAQPIVNLDPNATWPQ